MTSNKLPPMPVVSTGDSRINDLLGEAAPGFPRGRITIVEGDGSVGKTRLGLKAIAKAHWEGLRAAYLSPAYKFDPNYAQSLGVDWKKFSFREPPLWGFDSEITLPAAVLKLAADFDLIVVDDFSGYEEYSFRQIADEFLASIEALTALRGAVVLNISGHRGMPLALKVAAYVRLELKRERAWDLIRIQIIKTMAAPTQGNSAILRMR